MINQIKQAIDLLDTDKLYYIACQAPERFFTYISPRYVGKKRLDKLRTFLIAQENQIPDMHFLKILRSKTDKYSSDILFP